MDIRKLNPNDITPEICLKAVESNINNMAYVPDKFKTCQLCLIALGQFKGDSDDKIIKHFPEKFNTINKCMAIIDGIKYIDGRDSICDLLGVDNNSRNPSGTFIREQIYKLINGVHFFIKYFVVEYDDTVKRILEKCDMDDDDGDYTISRGNIIGVFSEYVPLSEIIIMNMNTTELYCCMKRIQYKLNKINVPKFGYKPSGYRIKAVRDFDPTWILRMYGVPFVDPHKMEFEHWLGILEKQVHFE